MSCKSVFTIIVSAILIVALTTPAISQFNPGDANNDGSVNTTDAVFIINLLCAGGDPPDPLANGDANGDCFIDISDARFIIDYVFMNSFQCVDFPDTACTDIEIGICEDTELNLHDNSFCDPVFPVCPMGDAAFRVYLRDEYNIPVSGFQFVWIELINCNDPYDCDVNPLPQIVCPIGRADSEGVLTFYLNGGKCDSLCSAVIIVTSFSAASMATQYAIDTVPVRLFDTDGDLLVEFLDDYTGNICNDYNGDGIVNTNDATIFNQHLNHDCNPDPCKMFDHTFRLIPESNLEPGQEIILELALANNSPDTCYVGNIEFYSAPFSTADDYTLFHIEPYDQLLYPGLKDTIVIDYTIPDDGQGCLKTIFTTDCCIDPIESMPKCFNSIEHCSADSNVCYNFHIDLETFPVEDIIFNTDQLQPGWTLVETHVPPTFPINSPDYIEYQICTPNNINLGDSAKMQVYVCYDTQCSDVDIFETRVVITSRSGDTNGDCTVNVSDAVVIINYVFSGGYEPLPYISGDVNCDESVNLSDAVYIINYVFVPESPPPCFVE